MDHRSYKNNRPLTFNFTNDPWRIILLLYFYFILFDFYLKLLVFPKLIIEITPQNCAFKLLMCMRLLVNFYAYMK